MDEDGESSEGEGGRIAVIQRQAKRRMLNMRHIPRDSVDTTATLPEYTSSPPAESSSGTEAMMAPPRYPKLTAEEEADEERDEVGDVVRRVRVRRRRSMSTSSTGSDPYLDSLLARSVHALELSNALLQSSMTTQSSLSALLAHDEDRLLDRSLDSHARFLAGQVRASDARRAWVDDIARQVDSLEYEYPPPSPAGSALGLSQSLPRFTRRVFGSDESCGDRCRHRRRSTESRQTPTRRTPALTPPRAMTQHITARANTPDGIDSILIPSTNGLRAAPRVHSFVPGSRKSSGDYGEFAKQQLQQYGTRSGTSTPVSPRRSLSVSAQHSPHASMGGGVYQHGNMSSPQVLQHPYASHQSHTPIRPILSSVPAEPSTAAYNMLSAIALRSPAPGSESGASGSGITRSDLGPRFTNDLGPRFINDLGPHAELGRGYGRGRGGSGTWVTIEGGVGGGSGLRRTRSATPSSRGAFAASPVVSPSSKLRDYSTTSTTMSSPLQPNTYIPGTASPGRSKPPTRTSSRTTSSGSLTTAMNLPPGPSQSSPGARHVVRHPYLQTARQNQSQLDMEAAKNAEAEQKFKSAGVLRRILDASKPQHDEPDAQEDAEEEERGRGTVRAKGKQPAKRPRLPTWSVIPPTGTTVKVEAVTPGGLISIEGMSGVGSVGSAGGSKSAVDNRFKHEERSPLELAGEHPRLAGPRPVMVPRSRSAGPSNRLGSLFAAASLPKIPVVFGRAAEAEPPPVPALTERPSRESERTVMGTEDGKAKGKERERPKLEIETEALDGLPRRRTKDELPDLGGLRVQLNGATIDTDAGPSNSRLSDASESDSENGSQPSHASLPLPARLFNDTLSRRPSSLRLPGSPRPSSLRQPGSGASTPRSVTFSPLPPKHVSSGSRPLSEAKVLRRRNRGKEKEREKPGWFASWFGPLPSPSGSSMKSGYGAPRRGWDSPRSMDDWQM